MSRTDIEWTRGDDGTRGETWNPVTGCEKVSDGCENCYAETFAERWRGVEGHPYEQGFDVRLWPDRLSMPFRWRKPRRVFVNSMSDLFHKAIPTEYIAKVFAVMIACPQHTFQVLTKRHGRMAALLCSEEFWSLVSVELGKLWGTPPPAPLRKVPCWIWIGVSVENQFWAMNRLSALEKVPAWVRFVSCEPLLGPLDLRPWLKWLNWVIAGGESGPKARAVLDPDWIRSLRDQCVAAAVAFFFKQWGVWLPVAVEDDPTMAGGRGFDDPRGGRTSATIREGRGRSATVRAMRAGDRNGNGVMLDDTTILVRVGKKKAGRLLDGRVWDEFPRVAGDAEQALVKGAEAVLV